MVEQELGVGCSTEPVLNGSILCLEITIEAALEPISYDGTFWLFNGSNSIAVSKDEVERIFSLRSEQDSLSSLSQESTFEQIYSSVFVSNQTYTSSTTETAEPQSQQLSWEMTLQSTAQQSDLNAKSFLMITELNSPETIDENASLGMILECKLECLNLKDKGSPSLTNAGVLLLHNNPEKFIPSATVLIAKFEDKSRQPVMMSEVRGPLIHQLNESLHLLNSQYLENTSASLLPSDAIREALLNALTHKDYLSGTPIRIAVYPDRLVIKNPSESATSEIDIAQRKHPKPHNPLLANALRMMGITNGWGDSLNAISDLCEQAGVKAPVIKHDNDHVSVALSFEPSSESSESDARAFQRLSVAADADKKQKATLPSENIGLSMLGANLPKNTPFNVRSVAAANNLDLTLTDEYVLRVLHTNGRVTALRIANVLGVSESTVRRSFRKLREHRLITRIGSDKAGYWQILS